MSEASDEASIAALREALEALRRQERDHGDRLRTLAHEFNQPLTAAVTYLKVARRLLIAGNKDPEDILGAIDKAGDQMLRAAELAGRLREFSRRDEAGDS